MRRRAFALAAVVAALALVPAPAALAATGAAFAPGAASAPGTGTAPAPGAASAPTADTVLLAPGAAAACTVTGGSLTWGVKESFRAYISGSIANGSWEATAPASYATPDFSWPATAGEFDPATSTGEVHFSGAVVFTGHNGLLNTTIANPSLTFAADGSARMLLDLTSLSMDDALAGNTANAQTVTQTPFVDLDLSAAPLTAGQSSVTATAVPTTVTPEGYAAFGNYEAGTPFDPITFTVDLDCAAAAATSEPTPLPVMTPEPAAGEADPSAPTWIPWAVAGGIVLAAGAIAAVLIARRRRGSAADPSARGENSAADPSAGGENPAPDPSARGENGTPTDGGDRS